MKVKTVSAQPAQAPAAAAQSSRTPQVAAVRHIAPERPLRVWSLLLPPSFDRK